MNIIKLSGDDVPKLVHLTKMVQSLHAEMQPQRYRFVNDQAALEHVVRTHLEQPGAVGLAMESSGEIIGYLIAIIADTPDNPLLTMRKVVSLNEICVHPDARRQGIADELVNALKKVAKAEGAVALKSSYASFNIASEALMKKHGLAVVMTGCEGSI